VCPKHICMRVGQVDVSLSGDLVMFGTESFASSASGSAAVGGVHDGLVLNSRNNANYGFGGGLLPSALVLSLSTNQMGYDLGFTIGAYVGGNNVAVGSGGSVVNANGPGFPIALGTPGIDLRQVFGTIGTPTFGTVKIGRDLGLFGSDAILNDATLLGDGTAANIAAPGNTTLGRIGIGYVYADWIPQVTYTTPDYNGFTASFGAFTPLDTVGSIFQPLPSAFVNQSQTPMLQGQVKYKGAIGPGANLTLSADALWQEHRYDTGTVTLTSPGVASSISSWGVDGFGKVDVNGFSVVGYGYYGEGLGSTGLFFDAFSANGQQRASYGGYAQGSYTFGKFTLGASWGISVLEANSFDTLAGNFAYYQYMLKSNQSYVGFARYQLTSWMALQGEYVHSIATNQTGGKIQADQIDFGTAWFF
ncbi:MAG: porin, partial [Methylovirgula sp.]